MIKHIWFDFAGTLFRYSKEYKKAHDELLYKTYSKIIRKSVTEKLKKEYQALYKKHGTNSQVFISLGKYQDFWVAQQIKLDKTRYIKKQVNYQSLFKEIRKYDIKISLFTNALRNEVLNVLTHLGLNGRDFDNLLTGEMVEKKPSLDDYYKLIKLSGLKPSQILYVGDRIDGEILPARKVGLKTALVWSKKRKTEADFTLKNIKEVLNCLKWK